MSNDPNINPNAPTLGPGGTQQSIILGPGGVQKAKLGPHGEKPIDTSLVMFQVIQQLIAGMGSLNNYLKTMSETLLQMDINKNISYANLLSALHLESVPANVKMTARTAQNINFRNQQKMMLQQTYQALLKNAQNQGNIDTTNASTTTQNQQSLGSLIGSLLDAVLQGFGNINTMNR